MIYRKPSKLAKDAEKCLKQAVRDEFQRKALLGQYVIIKQNGKARRIPAKQALKSSKSK